MSKRQAVVDLGTHSCLLLVAERGPNGELEVLEDHCEVPRFGAGLDKSGVLSDEAVARVERVLADYARRAAALGCARLFVGGTAALRRAGNQAAVLARLTKPGIEIEVLSEEEEARLGWTAVAQGNPRTSVVDVGGGSTEVVARGAKLLRSVPVGAVVLTERCQDLGWEALYAEARAAIAGLAAFDSQEFELQAEPDWVALGGTPSNLAALELGLERFDHLAVEGAVLQTESALRWGQRLAGLSLEERCRLPIEAPRAAVLPAGLACLGATLSAFGVLTFRVSGRGLRYGLMDDLLRFG